MKEPSFEATPEFQHFKEVMRGVLKVPKARLDELIRGARTQSTRTDNPSATGKKRKAKRTKQRRMQ
jgi:hypothetical protein